MFIFYFKTKTLCLFFPKIEIKFLFRLSVVLLFTVIVKHPLFLIEEKDFFVRKDTMQAISDDPSLSQMTPLADGNSGLRTQQLTRC